MSMRDEMSETLVKRVISATRVADNTAQVGQIIDRRGFNALTYIFNIGAIADADATFTALLEEGDDAALADAAAVADADMISQTPAVKDVRGAVITPAVAPEAAASFQFDSDNQVRKLGYIGNKRYTRLTITPAANGGNADFGVVALLEDPANAPVAQGTS